MSTPELTPAASGVGAVVGRVSPLRDPSRLRRLVKVLAWLAGTAVLLIVLDLLGVDVSGWLSDLWDSINDISLEYIIAGAALQLTQTTFVAYAWYSILAYAYPGRVQWMSVLATYAISVALNNVLPANLGSVVMWLMLLAIIPGSTFPGIFAAYLVQKIFFTIVGGLVYLYLFLTVPGSFDVELGFLKDNPAVTLIVVAGAAVLAVIVVRLLWKWIKKLWEQAREGGAILTEPRRYLTRVFLPQLLGYCAKLGVIAVFLAAYAVPVTFHSIMSVVGSSSLANVTSVTPGGVGVNQAANVVALRDYTDSATATAYSVSQQLVTTSVNMIFAVILGIAVFGWTGSKQLVGSSYVGAKEKAAEMKSVRHRHRGDGDEADEEEEAGAEGPPETSPG